MTYRELLAKDSFWMKDTPDIPIVLSSRIRLARNIADNPFPHVMSYDDAEKIEAQISGVLDGFIAEKEKLVYIPLKMLIPVEKKVLIEKHLVSPGFKETEYARGLALSESHKIAVMVNEEDHLRIQVLMPGNSLREAWHLAGLVDDHLEAHLDIAYKEKFGYLTTCPTNVGTGLRVSVMVHLPALVLTNQVQQVLGALTSLGLAVRGVYGEGSRSFGNIFQISNQVTLGKSEEDTLAHLDAVTRQLMEREVQMREVIRKESPLIVEDKVWRARGTLENARILETEEIYSLLSEDRLGIDMGILPRVSAGFVSVLINSMQGCLQYNRNKQLDAYDINAERAHFVRGIYHQKMSENVN
ncbi:MULTISPECIES: protein arginine kinase [unclassified Dehalobacter]|uniref:protein arginine kinase n=1 Tax=unclassified Dehalobacter TaxID=2635733 RepID=UPI000E6B76E7|nr:MULTISPECIES: protein arginine kinase [unclassified Dehalobacter]RJE48091.1 protein arginine kinase [Dehalobacter sp. MCB1]TCX49564.1 protein arginine kinase [Dehalobacter sp. 14DCB1]TCX50312.1 protein arginine kinase [Dehalobacter sp. 12DCB1]